MLCPNWERNSPKWERSRPTVRTRSSLRGRARDCAAVISQHDRFDYTEPGHSLTREVRAVRPGPLALVNSLVADWRHAYAAVRPGCTVLVVDERAAESFTAPGDEIERFFAAASAIWCLPQGRVGPGPELAGTLIRRAAMRGLARWAGHVDGQILPIEDPVWRFCGLVP